ncbi:peptidoglycan DD-metalloendopeptidase family protein [Sphingobacterium phlebotomi]|uniref:Peptidoglycan DD-metalloendopeptidase family protein n=1 Tax=Sphingobacterium phlebotomi TaxID=2605433 RepID=A0A5D4H8S1_9SPHI|nr:PKD domain-containing protein [Sphingobacterium phlebotomi]TYR35805.1 peptidoglycan DD-metalloendopeptidase family protein [Sphingobacterium phlebotomi]
MKSFLLTCFGLFIAITSQAWPVYVHLDLGETQEIMIGGETHQIKLHKILYVSEPNNRKPASIGSETLIEARVLISVDGEETTLVQRPYQMPVTFKGLRLYVENTQDWAKKATYSAIEHFPKAAKLAVVRKGESWGPHDMHFPLLNYRWRSSMYNNTWNSLVPGPGIYYHHGEDYGLMYDKFDIQAPLAGIVIESPLPHGDGKSNGVTIAYDEHFSYRISHMNIGTIRPGVKKGAAVKNGQVLAKSGHTYLGKEKMGDPHLHINFIHDGELVSTYPFLVEAYLRDYADNILAVAGGYARIMAGEEIELDATRTVVREGYKVAEYTWTLPDGQKINKAKTKVRFDKPGNYTAELHVKSDKDDEDKDFLKIYVYNQQKENNDYLGMFYHFPVRDIQAGEEVTIWKTSGFKKPVTIDFGDGSRPVHAKVKTSHVYKKPGIYTVTFSGINPSQRPTMEKIKIVVDKN